MSASGVLAGAFLGALGGGTLAFAWSSGALHYRQPEAGNLAGDVMAKGIEGGLRLCWVIFATVCGAFGGMVVGGLMGAAMK